MSKCLHKHPYQSENQRGTYDWWCRDCGEELEDEEGAYLYGMQQFREAASNRCPHCGGGGEVDNWGCLSGCPVCKGSGIFT